MRSFQGSAITGRPFFHSLARKESILSLEVFASAIKCPLPETPKQVLSTFDPEIAIATYRCLCCEGMARVDFFVKENKEVIVNEINTIPGFTRISMYPKMWMASGMPYTRLLDRLIELALERHRQEASLKTAFC